MAAAVVALVVVVYSNSTSVSTVLLFDMKCLAPPLPKMMI